LGDVFCLPDNVGLLRKDIIIKPGTMIVASIEVFALSQSASVSVLNAGTCFHFPGFLV